MKIIEMAYKGQSSHIACSFSIVEIMTTLYKIFYIIQIITLMTPKENILF